MPERSTRLAGSACRVSIAGQHWNHLSTGPAVALGFPITNSGTLRSTNGAALSDLSNFVRLNNQAGGIVAGANGVAIAAFGGFISNAGTINGSVDLSTSTFGPSGSSSIYIAAGGLLNGDLKFGAASDVLVETGSGYGVTGVIDGGAGANFVGHERSASSIVALGGTLPTDFQQEFVSALGAATIATITASAKLAEDIDVAGDGQIVNRADTSGSVSELTGLASTNYAPSNLELASFTNDAAVAGLNLRPCRKLLKLGHRWPVRNGRWEWLHKLRQSGTDRLAVEWRGVSLSRRYR